MKKRKNGLSSLMSLCGSQNKKRKTLSDPFVLPASSHLPSLDYLC